MFNWFKNRMTLMNDISELQSKISNMENEITLLNLGRDETRSENFELRRRLEQAIKEPQIIILRDERNQKTDDN